MRSANGDSFPGRWLRPPAWAHATGTLIGIRVHLASWNDLLRGRTARRFGRTFVVSPEALPTRLLPRGRSNERRSDGALVDLARVVRLPVAPGEPDERRERRLVGPRVGLVRVCGRGALHHLYV